MAFIFATETTDYTDADGGAFFGYIGVACALVFASFKKKQFVF